MNTTTSYSQNGEINVGIDVDQTSVELFIFERQIHWKESNTRECVENLLYKLDDYKPTRILVEAKGPPIRYVIEACAEKALPVVLVQPTQVHQYLTSQAQLATVERANARLIAQLGAAIKPEPRPISSKKLRYLEELLDRKRQLSEIKAEELQRKHKIPKTIAAAHTNFLTVVNKEIAWIKKTLAKEVAEGPEWLHIYEILSCTQE